jgi:type I pantothenate kinase
MPSWSGAGLMQRKGFPESYDRRALLRFVADDQVGDAASTRPNTTI